MLYKLTLFTCILALSMGFCSAGFGEEVAPPPPPAVPPAPVDAQPSINPPPSPSTSAPSLCVVNALRVLNAKMLPQMAEQLKLTDEQKAKISAIIAASDEAQKPLIQTQRRVAEQFVGSLMGPNLQEVEVQAGADLAMKSEAAILTHRVKTLFAIRQVLTPDQITALDTMISRTTLIWRPAAMMDRIRGTTPGAMPVSPAAPDAPSEQPK